MSDMIQVEVDEDLEDLIPGFLENRKKDVENISTLIAENNFDELRSIGHSLKGVGGGYGFDEITRIGAEIEMAAKENQSEVIQRLGQELADYLSAVNVVYV